jgi:hypothetical protein
LVVSVRVVRARRRRGRLNLALVSEEDADDKDQREGSV